MHGLARCLEVFEEMKAAGYAPDSFTYTFLIERFVADGDILGAMDQLREMRRNNVPPAVFHYSILARGFYERDNARGVRQVRLALVGRPVEEN